MRFRPGDSAVVTEDVTVWPVTADELCEITYPAGAVVMVLDSDEAQGRVRITQHGRLARWLPGRVLAPPPKSLNRAADPTREDAR